MPLSDLARAVEDRFHKDTIPVFKRWGWRPRVIAYDGYGSTTIARVMARMVLRPEGVPADGPLFRSLPEELPTSMHQAAGIAAQGIAEAQRGWRSFVDAPVPYLPVTVKVGQARMRTRADRAGYIDLVVRGHGLGPGLHQVEVKAVGSRLVTSTVLIVPPGPRLGIVSDIDDTVVVSHVPRILVAAYNQLVKYSSAREPVPGMAELLTHVRSRQDGAPMIYLSTGAWNVVPTMRSFLQRHGYPAGPMLMTDWGPTNTGWFRSGIEHKRTQLRRLMLDLPDVRWLLVGDDGQHDPLIYGEVARDHAEKIAAIAIRRLTTGEKLLAGSMGLEPGARTLGQCPVPVVFGQDGFELARQLPREVTARA
ncbi:App1 family protein [Actinomyces trachealis]|uniref:App1 family protein n=1 Tax=Actinomyces trachealis TaxID=2763540 RepID=UPI001892B264|nr:phosphatase domain-containing protein [Actinomyces trachealis]